MNILHITPHLGGGVGTVVMDWVEKASKIPGDHVILCLDYANEKAMKWHNRIGLPMGWNYSQHRGSTSPCGHSLQETDEFRSSLDYWIAQADIVLVHYWDHPMLKDLFSRPIPPCRMIFWCHKNVQYAEQERAIPDLWVNTSPVQGGFYIWSTGDMSRFLAIEPKPHEGFNIGTVLTPKTDLPLFFKTWQELSQKLPECRFTAIGDMVPMNVLDYPNITFTGKVDDIAPYLAEMDVFGYPLKPDHYGTCEQALGEAMAAGLPVVTMNNEAERLITGEPIRPVGSSYAGLVYTFYRSPDLRQTFSGLMRERAREVYNLDVMIAQWDAVLGQMMTRPKKERQ